jgi:hypothetical protein
MDAGSASFALNATVPPAWFRGATRPSGSVLVTARSAAIPTVVLARTGLLEDLVSHVASEAR